MAKREQDTKAFKVEAVRLANDPDQRFTRVAQNLGGSASTLHRPTRKLGRHESVACLGHGKAELTPEQAETGQLQRELDIASQERNVLNKAVACPLQNGRA